ncbi:hypothetical protein GCM10023170_039840 [Phytohabitans houttuyneae]|uniref:Uncharacterized protein n=1 Tax=Phytohabitans houttuyneae TaxID=1076126 RepID=A0A6V8KY85_9ACTN|nr:hypothetical protein Phou_096750 [Phytohabitans houttuyneae]
MPRQYCVETTSGASIAKRSTGAVIIQARSARVRLEVSDATYGSTVVETGRTGIAAATSGSPSTWRGLGINEESSPSSPAVSRLGAATIGNSTVGSCTGEG